MDKYVYVIISKTQSHVGSLIRWFTKYAYNHVSISLDRELSQMYSFGRITIGNPLVGGMVKETTYTLTFGLDKNIDVKVYAIPVSNEQYEKIEYFVHNTYKDCDGYYYNLLGIFGIVLGKRWSLYKTYTCAEFVVDALRSARIGEVCKNDNMVYPRDVDEALQRLIIYEGSLLRYPYLFWDSMDNSYINDKFFLRNGFTRELLRSLLHFKMLLVRHYKNK